MVRKGQVRYRQRREGSIVHHEWTWTSNSDGDALMNMEMPIEGIPWRLVTQPLEDAPSANYNVTLLDESGADALLGKGASRSATDTETVFIGDATAVETRTIVSGRCRFRVAAAGASKNGAAILSVVDRVADVQLPRL